MSQSPNELSRSIKGSVAIITGAASGMGRATAQLFAQAGAHIALFDINASALNEVANEINATGGTALPIAVDLMSRSAVEQAIKHVAEHYSAIDILVNNAGFASLALIEDDNYEQVWDASFAVMTTAQAWAIRAALPSLRASSNPRIINIASTEGLGATLGNSAYVAAKHASIGLTRGMAVDLGRDGITVNCICPGPIHTGITETIPDEQKTLFAKRRTALRRYGAPEEVAHATLSLALPAASFITGAVLPVDGGLSIRNA